MRGAKTDQKPKVRLQTQHHGEKKSLGEMITHVMKSDGVKGFYRGVRGIPGQFPMIKS